MALTPVSEIPEARNAFRCFLVYLAVLPLFIPQLTILPGLGKVIVLADVAFAALLAAVLRVSRHRLFPLQRDVVVMSACPLIGLSLSLLATGLDGRAVLDLCRAAYSMTVFLLFAQYRFTAAERLTLAKGWVLVAVLIALVGLLPYLGATFFHLPQTLLAYTNSPNLGALVIRIASTLGSTTLALYLQTAVLLGVWLFGQPAVSRRFRRRLAVGLALLILVTVFTMSRSFIGLMLSLAMVGFLAKGRVQGLWRLRWGLACVTGVVIVVGVAGTIWAIFPVQARVEAASSTLRVDINLQKNAYYILHAAGLRMFKSHPIVGVGSSGFGRQFGEVTTPEERRTSWPPLSPGDEDPHSTWFGWAAKSGLLGLGGWVAVYAWVLWQLLRRDPRGDSPFTMRQVIGCGLAGLLLNGFHVEIAHLKFIWAFAGLGLACRPAARGS